MGPELSERVQEYEIIRPVYERFTKKLKNLIEELITGESIEYHLIEARTKSIEGFQEKISRPGKHYDNPQKEVTDLSGLRIAVYYLEDVKRVAELLEREFVIDRPNSFDKGALLEPNEFGYRSIHYVVSLSKARSELKEWNEFKNIKAEIQIRTVLQHAWAAINHALRYKKETDVPSQLRRRLFRLSGLLELADEEFSAVKENQCSLQKEFRKKLKEKDPSLEINVIVLWEYIEMSTQVRNLVETAKKNGAKICSPKEYDLSELVTCCSAAGITKIGQLDAFLKKNLDKTPAYYSNLMSSHSLTTNACYLIIYLLVPSHPSVFSTYYLKQKRWSEDLVKDILAFGKDIRAV